jgi:hypothetical protein
MTTRSMNGDGTRLSDPIHTPAPAPAPVPPIAYGPVLNEWFEKGFKNYADELLEALAEDVINLMDDRKRVEAELRAQVKSLEREVAELRGAVDCMRSLGRAGLRMRGPFDAAGEYLANDVVTRNGSSFVATRDRPGPCPGEGWELLCSRGGRGERGPAGPRGQNGPRGTPAPEIKHWLIDKQNFTAAPILTSGEVGAPLELKALFQEFLDQTRAGG